MDQTANLILTIASCIEWPLSQPQLLSFMCLPPLPTICSYGREIQGQLTGPFHSALRIALASISLIL
jgi:hypothetical protein